MMMYAGGTDSNVPFVTKFSHKMKNLKCMKEGTAEGGHESETSVTRLNQGVIFVDCDFTVRKPNINCFY